MMKEKDILSKVINKGLQINRDSIKYIHENNLTEDILYEIIKQAEQYDKLTIDLEDVKKIDKKAQKENQSPILIQENPQLQDNITIDEIIQDKLNTYDSMRNILQNRWELTNIISINKIGQNVKIFSLIAEIISIDNKHQLLTLQDNTGTIDVSTYGLDEEQLKILELNDVIGFLCENENVIRITKIITPDIPLFKNRKLPDKKTAVIFSNKNSEDAIQNVLKNHKDKYEKSYILTIDADKIALFSVDGTTILVCGQKFFPNNENPIQTMTNFLKKRMINYKKINDVAISPFIINPAPDIFVSNAGKNEKSIYKNTILISIDENAKENICWLIDLQTYESLKISLG